MRAEDNPYTPNAGAEPRYLAGREHELDAFRVLLRRMKKGHTDQSMIVVGLRGVGKTVLLNTFRAIAEDEGDLVAVEAEITKHEDFGHRMGALARRALFSVAPSAKWRDRSRHAAAVLRSFQITVTPQGELTASLGGVDAAEGAADSGNLADDLTDVLLALGEAAAQHGKGVVFILDEVQFLSLREFEALIAALHKTVQRRLPITLVAAGLPQLPELAGEAKSYAERLFRFPAVDSLDAREARKALIEPARDLGVAYTDDAVDAILGYTGGYPYFIQEYGSIVWNLADTSPVTGGVVADAREAVEAKLDESFFRVRADRTTDAELRYLRAMAELGPEAQLAGDVAAVLGRKSTSLGPTRARLIEKGLLWTPSHGYAAFTVPQFDQYMKRTYELGVSR
ncbi:AAA family ATPase [Svornostia abyssi]|uniref:AAA family ATPase n=1 Tax=Svornostia abyssi TaxID=2898438 RepID=A0ABY5PL55_9ACTN|nr:AAA family ATPase [Parviterribacteraceae bacterium J379]